MNPNNCDTCDYKKMNTGQEGWCYMFKDEATEVCMQHTGRKKNAALKQEGKEDAEGPDWTQRARQAQAQLDYMEWISPTSTNNQRTRNR